MTTITATEASRGFSEMLNKVAAGETFTITRGNKPIATIAPPAKRTFGDLMDSLDELRTRDGWEPPDEDFEKRISDTLDNIDSGVRNPWEDR